MAEPRRLRPWAMRAAYLALALAILFFQLLPLDTLPPRWAPPDLLVALTLAWSVRRPDSVPTLSVAGAMLLADLLLQRPPGLMAALVVLGSRYLKRRARGLRDGAFAAEWLAVATVAAGILLAHRMVLALLMVDQPPLGLSLIQMAMTVLAYPAVVGLSHLLLGLRRSDSRELEAAGGRA